MYKTQNAVKNYFDTLVKENIKERDVRSVVVENGNLNIITNNKKIIKIQNEKKH